MSLLLWAAVATLLFICLRSTVPAASVHLVVMSRDGLARVALLLIARCLYRTRLGRSSPIVRDRAQVAVRALVLVKVWLYSRQVADVFRWARDSSSLLSPVGVTSINLMALLGACSCRVVLQVVVLKGPSLFDIVRPIYIKTPTTSLHGRRELGYCGRFRIL